MSLYMKDAIENSDIILIKDSEQSGIGLLKSLVAAISDDFSKIHVLLYEVSVSTFMKQFPPSKSQWIKYHSVINDPLGWNGGTSLTLETDVLQYLKNQFDHEKTANKSVVVIDSLSNLILHHSPAYTCQVLQKVCRRSLVKGTEISKVICLVHKDMHEPSSLLCLEHTATTVLTVSPPISPGFTLSCHIVHKKSTGKVLQTNEELKLAENLEIIAAQPVKTFNQPEMVMANVDPTANLTFNLNLNEKEKEARSQIQLPYLYDKHRKEDVLKKSVGEGKIFYQPDEADDFDEEDPDDDLDI